MKRLALFLTFSLALGIATPIMPTDDAETSAIKESLGHISKGVEKLVDAMNNAWQKAAFKKNLKEGTQDFTKSFATQMICAGVGIASFVFFGLGFKKLIDNRDTPPSNDEADKKQKEAQQKRERRSGVSYMVFGFAGTLASLIAIRNIA